jgi:hypothetical protein
MYVVAAMEPDTVPIPWPQAASGAGSYSALSVLSASDNCRLPESI